MQAEMIFDSTLTTTQIASGSEWHFTNVLHAIEEQIAVRSFRARLAAYLGLKRALDVAVAASLLLALSPLFALTALLVKFGSAGPIFFSQIRVGRNGKRFRMYKFRTMCNDAEARKAQLIQGYEAGGARFKMKRDPRITGCGRVMRRLSIDELPQLWNVLNGDMTLVGPRPSVEKEVELYNTKERKRLQVTPGLTCIWQVSGRSDIDFAGQVDLDIKYIHSRSIATDLELLLRTIPAVLSGRGAY